MQGDAIHEFVKAKCGGKWPGHAMWVTITLGSMPYAFTFQFRGFTNPYNGAPACKLAAAHAEDEDLRLIEPDISLSDISSWKSEEVMPADQALEHLCCRGFGEVLVKLRNGPWERYMLNKVLATDIGPQLIMKKYPSFQYEQIVYMSSLDRVTGVKFEIVPYNSIIVGVLADSSGNPCLPIPCMVRARMSGDHEPMLRDKSATFFGYSFDAHHIGKVFVHLCVGNHHYMVETNQISCLRFLRIGVE
jgi:hypothetical protein